MHDTRIGRFFAVDPLAGSYPHNSPYAFSENRVIDAVELEGLEQVRYFTVDEKGNRTEVVDMAEVDNRLTENVNVYMYQNLNGTSGHYKIRYEGQTSKDIHESRSGLVDGGLFASWYSQDITENKVDKQQLTKFSKKNIRSIESSSKWQTQFDSRFGSEDDQKTACWKACQVILTNYGVIGGANSNVIQTVRENENSTALVVTTDAKKGVDYIDSQLEAGKPILVGVDHTLGNTYNEKSTDHFVVIVGRDSDEKGTYYLFHDVGTRNIKNGTSDKNRLYLKSDNSLVGTSKYKVDSGSKHAVYTVTQVRRNTGTTD